MTVPDLAWAVTETSLRASVALAGVLALRWMIAARTGAGVRRALLLAAVLAVPLLPIAGAILPGFDVGASRPVDLAALPGSIDLVPIPAAPSDGFLPSAIRLAAFGWIVGAAMMLSRLGVGVLQAARLAGAARPLEDAAWLADRDAVVAALAARRAPEIRVASREIVPSAWGVLRPVVLLPPSALRWTADRRRAVLAHEVGHLARHEPLALIAVEVVRAVHWFDPLVRLAATRFRRESERAADEAALGTGIDAADYAGHLVALARARLVPPPCRAVAGLASGGELQGRVESILVAGTDRPGTGRSAAVMGVAGLALAAVLVTAVPRLAPAASLAALHAERFRIPVELADEIVRAARLEGIADGLAFALVAEESGFDPDRVSPGGAIGLTQIMPATAREVDPRVDRVGLREVPVNLRVGFRYLRTQIEREGDVRDALLAYNLGPRRLAELRESGVPVSTDYPDRILNHSD